MNDFYRGGSRPLILPPAIIGRAYRFGPMPVRSGPWCIETGQANRIGADAGQVHTTGAAEGQVACTE